MPEGWSFAADSPLLPLIDRRKGRARFEVAGVEPTGDGAGQEVEGLLAGAAEVDITPPPGLPKAGYSRNAHTGSGFRSRLRARVLHLRAGRTSLAVVQCDLLGGSAVVQHLVARAIAERTDVPLSGLMIGATHTHGGPGQFLGTRFYNRFASNKVGFDAAWAQQLSERIAGGVVEAVETRCPARMAVGSTEIWGLTRNRSLRPHVRNRSVADDRTGAQRAYVSVNPHLHLIRVDTAAEDGGYEPLAATVVFSVHGTGVPMQSHEYNADLWAYLVDELGGQIARGHGQRPVVGAIEGTHADVAPALHPGTAGHLEAQRVGRGIGREAAALYERLEKDLTGEVSLAAGLREVDLDRSRSIGSITLPRRPAVGAALIAGAYENETPVVRHVPPFRAGSPKPAAVARGPQGVKWVLGGPFQRLVLPSAGFPRVVPVQVLRLGPALLVGLPFELTVETGRRIEAAVLDQSESRGGDPSAGRGRDGGVDRVIVTSVANEYAGYCATPEEYGLQHYEGGHTLYGPQSQPFFTAHAARLADETLRTGGVSDVASPRRFDLLLRRYLPPSSSSGGGGGGGEPVERAMLGPASFTDATARSDPYWEQRWRDVGPGDLHWHEPLVRLECSDRDGDWQRATTDDGRPIDDQGCDVEVVHLGGDRYAARWWGPAFRSYRRHRFVILPNADRPRVIGDPFD